MALQQKFINLISDGNKNLDEVAYINIEVIARSCTEIAESEAKAFAAFVSKYFIRVHGGYMARFANQLRSENLLTEDDVYNRFKSNDII